MSIVHIIVEHTFKILRQMQKIKCGIYIFFFVANPLIIEIANSCK